MSELEYYRNRCEKLEQLVKELFREAYGKGFEVAQKVVGVLEEKYDPGAAGAKPSPVENILDPIHKGPQPSTTPVSEPPTGKLDI